MKNTLLSASVAAALVLGASSSAFAQATTIKLGFLNAEPNSSATAINGPFSPVDALSLKVKSKSTLFFSASRDITDNWDVELSAGLPPTHDVAVVVLKPASLPPSVAAQDGAIGAKVRQVAPTLFANYKFGDKASQIRPFVGVGVNYTVFDKADSTSVGDAINGGPTTLKLEDSVGLALQVGITAKLGGAWSITGALATAQVKTKLLTNTLGIERRADIKFSPTVFIVSAGYSF